MSALCDSESSRQRKERLQYKIITAAQTSFAKNALLEDRNQFLTKINDESKPRRITKSVTLGKARVMSYEDLEKAQAQRAAKEARKRPERSRQRLGESPLRERGNLVKSVRRIQPEQVH